MAKNSKYLPPRDVPVLRVSTHRSPGIQRHRTPNALSGLEWPAFAQSKRQYGGLSGPSATTSTWSDMGYTNHKPGVKLCDIEYCCHNCSYLGDRQRFPSLHLVHEDALSRIAAMLKPTLSVGDRPQADSCFPE
ncbi:hypothetical protein D9619_010611 [Psilocybe cf. subviscida]|uniref:Uncharacterized protein n=1 Tax=Psilocybe cf. subviscida TaxID=2480587 RepID=A0A8H5F076_9AGAR|nr:hypothetical protein D9619_010611 [Psilocybe cf. subviscida]